MQTNIVRTFEIDENVVQDVVEVSIGVQEFLDALDKNGFPWSKGDFKKTSSNSSCAIGQAGRNLGFDPIDDYSAFWQLQDKFSSFYEGDSIIVYNDGPALSYADVVKYVHEKLDSFADQEVLFEYRKRPRYV